MSLSIGLRNFGRGHHEEHFCENILNHGFRRRRRLKIFLILSSGGPVVCQSKTICAILVEGIMRYIYVKLFLKFKDISYLELCWHFCLVEWNHLCYYARGHYEEHFCEIILNLDQ